jgi:hypothetical protein
MLNVIHPGRGDVEPKIRDFKLLGAVSTGLVYDRSRRALFMSTRAGNPDRTGLNVNDTSTEMMRFVGSYKGDRVTEAFNNIGLAYDPEKDRLLGLALSSPDSTYLVEVNRDTGYAGRIGGPLKGQYYYSGGITFVPRD